MDFIRPLYAFAFGATIISSIVSLVLFLNFHLQAKFGGTKSDNVLIFVSGLFSLCSFADAVVWLNLDNAGSYIFKICLIVDVELFQVVGAAFHMYWINQLKNKVKFPAYYEYYGFPIAIVEGLLWALSMTFDIFYKIEGNTYIETQYYIFAIFPMFILLGADLLFIVLYRQSLAKREIYVWIAYVIIVSVFETIGIITNTPAIYIAFLLILLITYLIIDMKKSEIIQEQQEHLEEEQALLALSQIKPHFIYNCLNVIQVLCVSQPELAETATHRFSCFLRGYIDAMDKVEMVPLEDELYIVENYIYLEKLRFGDRLKLKMSIDENDFFVPALSIEPFVENAIKYGILKKPEGGTLSIRTYKTADERIIEVSDDGVGFDVNDPSADSDSDEKKSHIGIKNVESRLTKLCMGYVTIDSILGVGTTSKIHIPIKKK